MNSIKYVFLVLVGALPAISCFTHYAYSDLYNRKLAIVFDSPFNGTRMGLGIGAAGDVNNDGYPDFLISAGYKSSSGQVFLVWGRNRSLWEATVFNFSKTDDEEASWISIKLPEGTTCTGIGSSSITSQDVNGDGISDLLIDGKGCSLSWIVFGHSGTWSSFTTDDIESNIIPGFSIHGTISLTSQTFLGDAGDLNGDGIHDILVSESLGFSTDNSYVVFGTNESDRQNIIVSSLDGSNGFQLVGPDPNTLHMLGYMIHGNCGDFNHDGIDDLIIGAPYADTSGKAYVAFGIKTALQGNWPQILNISNLNGTNGFIIQANTKEIDCLGWSTTGSFDFNHDGIDDVFVGDGCSTGYAHIIFGHESKHFVSPLLVSTLNGTNGFTIVPENTDSYLGRSGDGIGDFNGDGIDDIVIGGIETLNYEKTSLDGIAMIIFGKSGVFPMASISPSNLTSNFGFIIDGSGPDTSFGWSTQGVGDVDKDGFDDILISAPNFYYTSGQVILVFGRNYPSNCLKCSVDGKCSQCERGFIVSNNFSCVIPSIIDIYIDFANITNGTDFNELENEIASILGINVNEISVILISSTQVQVTLFGETISIIESLANKLIQIINNKLFGSESNINDLLRDAINAYIRKENPPQPENHSFEISQAFHLLPFMFIPVSLFSF